MRDRLDAALIAALVEDGNADSDQLLSRLEDDPSGSSIVNQLLAWPIGDVRFWALEAAMRIYSRHEYVRALDPSLEKVFILWTLAKIGAPDALPQIALLRSSVPDWSQLARVCDVVSVYLTQGEQPVLDSIRLHGDHVRMEEMCTLAWHVLATPAARDALDQCIANSPDGECRAKCQYALQRWDSES